MILDAVLSGTVQQHTLHVLKPRPLTACDCFDSHALKRSHIAGASAGTDKRSGAQPAAWRGTLQSGKRTLQLVICMDAGVYCPAPAFRAVSNSTFRAVSIQVLQLLV